MGAYRQGAKIHTPGTVAGLDDIVRKFIKSKFAANHIDDAQARVEGEFKDDRRAAFYPDIMTKIRSKGFAYVAEETQRIEKVMKGKITNEQHDEFLKKREILKFFKQAAKEKNEEL